MKVGERLRGGTGTEIIVVRAPATEVALTCAGAPMVPVGGDAPGAATEDDGSTLLGKRYRAEPSGLEVLCTKGGAGTLRADGEPLGILAAKNLPSSD